MKWKILLALVAALTIMASAASADILQGTGGAFQPYVTPNQNERPYWDGNSWDSGSAATIGNFLTRTGYFSSNDNTYSPALTDPQWWGGPMRKGTADPNISFKQTQSGATVQMLVEVAGLENYNYFGWYYIPAVGGPVMTEIFSGTITEPTSLNVPITLPNPVTNYGFYIGVDSDKNGTINNYYYMDSRLNLSDKDQQHFAVFQPIGDDALNRFPYSFFIGVEDLPICSSDKDFNDLVVRVTPSGGGNQIPLPPSAFLLGSGLLGLLALRGSRRGHKS
jgi:hypothetical protein